MLKYQRNFVDLIKCDFIFSAVPLKRKLRQISKFRIHNQSKLLTIRVVLTIV